MTTSKMVAIESFYVKESSTLAFTISCNFAKKEKNSNRIKSGFKVEIPKFRIINLNSEASVQKRFEIAYTKTELYS